MNSPLTDQLAGPDGSGGATQALKLTITAPCRRAPEISWPYSPTTSLTHHLTQRSNRPDGAQGDH